MAKLPNPYLIPKGVKNPLKCWSFCTRKDATNTQILLVEDLFIGPKMVLAECIHSWDDVQSSGDVVSLLQRAALALMHLLYLLLELVEEEGVLLNPRKAVSTVGNTVPYPIARSSPSWMLPLADWIATQTRSQRFPSGSGPDLVIYDT